MANIKISGNDILREGEKIGYIAGNDIHNEQGEKMGYFSGNDVYDETGRKMGYIEGAKFKSSDGRSSGIGKIEREIKGGNVSNLGRAAIKTLLGRFHK